MDNANRDNGQAIEGGKSQYGAKFYAEADGGNTETQTPRIRAGEASYDGKTNPPDMTGAKVPGSRDSIVTPMGVDLKSNVSRSSTVTKNAQPKSY